MKVLVEGIGSMVLARNKILQRIGLGACRYRCNK